MIKDIEKDMKIEKAFEDGYAKGREEGRNILSEVEGKLSEKCCVLAEENKRLKEQLESMEPEFARMRAQLDIVYLIFGGK